MKCVILGAGLAGLVCALELQRRGGQVTLIEAAPFAGGRASSWKTSSGMPVGAGLHVVAAHYVNLLEALASVGAQDGISWWDKHYYLAPAAAPVVWRYNRLPAPLHLLHTARRMPVSFAQRLRLLRAGLDAARYRQEDLAHLDELPYLDWHRKHRLGDSFLLELAELVSDAATFLPLERVSARAVLSWLKYMSSCAAAGKIGTWRVPLSEGLVDPLVRAIKGLGGEIRFQTATVRLVHEQGRIDRVVVRKSSAVGPCYRADGDASPVGPAEEIPCGFVVSALPVQGLRRLIDPPLAKVAKLEDALKLQTVPAVSVVIAFDRAIKPMPTGTPLVSGCAIRDFVDLTAFDNGARKNSLVQFLVRDSCQWLTHTDDEIVQSMLDGLRAVWPAAQEARPVEAHVERIGAAMSAAVPGTYRLRPVPETGIPNFFLAGDWTRHNLNSSMEGAAVSGKAAAQCVLRARGAGPVSVLTSREPLLYRLLQRVGRPRLRRIKQPI